MKKTAKSLALILLLNSAFASIHAGEGKGLWDDLTHFIKTNANYNHALTIGVAICSYGFFKHILHSNARNWDPWAVMGVAFLGSYITSRLAKENPATATLVAGGLIVLNSVDLRS